MRLVLDAWAAAIPIPAGTPGTEPTEDFDFVGATTEKGAIVYDYLIEKLWLETGAISTASPARQSGGLRTGQ